MSDGIDERAPGVVRATRYELLDGAGRLRGVWGWLSSPDPDNQPLGLALLDPDGRQRLWVALDFTGPNLAFDLGGNNLITLGVSDPAPDALHIGAYLQVADLDGTTVLGWRIEDDGSVTIRSGGPTR